MRLNRLMIVLAAAAVGLLALSFVEYDLNKRHPSMCLSGLVLHVALTALVALVFLRIGRGEIAPVIAALFGLAFGILSVALCRFFPCGPRATWNDFIVDPIRRLPFLYGEDLLKFSAYILAPFLLAWWLCRRVNAPVRKD
jgi:hypothetical protein